MERSRIKGITDRERANLTGYARDVAKANKPNGEQKMPKAYMIIDLQFGSTGKGLLAGYLAEKNSPDTLVTAWAPNAGHTYIDSGGRRFIHTMVPNGVVSPGLKRILIGPGSVIDEQKLWQEYMSVSDLVGKAELMIHPHAAVVTEDHRSEERSTMVGIGSTQKGVGAALVSKINRQGTGAVAITALTGPLAKYVCTINDYQLALEEAHLIQIEGAQGFSLSIHHGFYPYTTSRDVTPSQVMADCGVPHSMLGSVIGTMRTYPIRVANRYDSDGNQIGWSGPGYADQREMDWEEIGRSPEYTTVTKLPRRLFSFSRAQTVQALRQCRPNAIFLNFAQYIDEDGLNRLIDDINRIAGDIQGCGRVRYVGYGATASDIRQYREVGGVLDEMGVL